MDLELHVQRYFENTGTYIVFYGNNESDYFVRNYFSLYMS